MATDDERREVAARLRGGYDVVSDAHGRFWLNGTLFGMDITARSEERIRDGLARLADLIEPSGHECVPGECPLNVRHDNDRDALLALADELSGDTLIVPAVYGTYAGGYVAACQDIACRIREACGVER